MRRLMLFIFVMFLSACSKETPEVVAVEQGVITDWRVLISLPENDLPVTMYLAPDGSEAWFYNGREIVVVPEIEVEGNTRTLRFPTFNNTLRIVQTESGLSGDLTLVKRDDEQVMELREMAESVKVAASEKPAGDDTVLTDLTEQMSAIREYASQQQNRNILL